MKVEELIKRLSEFDGSERVFFVDYQDEMGSYDFAEVTFVKQDVDGGVILYDRDCAWSLEGVEPESESE